MDWNTLPNVLAFVVIGGLTLGGTLLWLERRDRKEKPLPPKAALRMADHFLESKYRHGYEVVVNNEPMTLAQARHYMHILQEKTGQGLPYMPFEKNYNKVVR